MYKDFISQCQHKSPRAGEGLMVPVVGGNGPSTALPRRGGGEWWQEKKRHHTDPASYRIRGWHRSRSLLCRCDAVVVGGGGGKERRGGALFLFPLPHHYQPRSICRVVDINPYIATLQTTRRSGSGAVFSGQPGPCVAASRSLWRFGPVLGRFSRAVTAGFSRFFGLRA